MPKLLTVLILAAAIQQGAAPSTPGKFVDGKALKAAADKALTDRGTGMGSANVVTGDHYGINLVKRDKVAGAISHPAGTEVHYIVEGGGTAVTGGHIVRPAGGGQATIEGGESRHVTVGDIVFIPAGTPHWYSQIDGSITYLETRFEVAGK